MSKFIVDFREAHTHADLATMIGCPPDFVDELVASPTRRERYFEIRIPKKNKRRKGEYRTVWQANLALCLYQKALLRRLELFLSEVLSDFPHPCAHGYIRGRNTLTNAQPHAGAELLLRADIKDFFGSISRNELETFFESIGIARDVARALGAFTTIDDALGQGIHTSPMLANAICKELDFELQRLAETHDCQYTRYADDIAISGPSLPTRVEVAGILNRFEFELSARKFRTAKRGQAQFVTGLSIADQSPRIPKKFKHKLRQDVYFASKYGIVEHAERSGYPTVEKCVNTIDGHITYCRSIEPALGGQLHTVWQEVMERDEVRPTYGHAGRQRAKDVHLFVDEAWVDSAQGQLLAVAVVLAEDAGRLEKEINKLLAEITADPFAAGRKSSLKKKGFHFTDDSEDTRTKVIELIGTMPIRGFVAFQRVPDKGDFKANYLRLLKWLLTERLAKQFHFHCHLICEQHSEIRQSDIDNALEEVGADLAEFRRRPAFKPQALIASKVEQKCLSIVDYLLAVTGKYISEEKSDLAANRFERLRDKIRLVIDADTQERFWRKNPLSKESIVPFGERGDE